MSLQERSKKSKLDKQIDQDYQDYLDRQNYGLMRNRPKNLMILEERIRNAPIINQPKKKKIKNELSI